MPDAPVTRAPARPARQVVLCHDEHGPEAAQISLEAIVARLSQTPADGNGLGSRVWRFAPVALAQGRPERADDIFHAMKWVNLSDPVRVAHLPCEFHWLQRLKAGCFPRPVAHAMLGESAYLLVAEWVEGRNLALHGPAIVADLIVAGRFDGFLADLTRIIEHLARAGIAHSDIWEPNIIVRNLAPVLIDFGWGRTRGTPAARDNMHQPDDERAMFQLMLRLGALRRMVGPAARRREEAMAST